MSAFVTNAEMQLMVSVTRSLGKNNVEVTCGSEHSDAISFSSKYCRNKVHYPSLNNEKDFIDYLEGYLRKHRHEVLLPGFADTLQAISRNRERLGKYAKIPIAGHDKIMKALSKAETIKFALENGIPCPKTFFLEKEEDALDARDKLDYPVVLKPSVGYGTKGLSYVKSPKELVPEYRKIASSYGKSILLQECIPLEGEAYGCEALFNADSKPRAVFVHKRLRSFPLTGGQSCMRESVSNPEVERLGLKLLSALGWYGVAMVEFKMDPRDNKPKLMEINPRFWGSIHLPIVSGVDFPYLLYRLAVEGDIEPVRGYKLGIKSRCLIPGDFRHLFSVLFDDFSGLGIKRPSRIKTLADFLDFFDRGTFHETLSFDDPLPALEEMRRIVGRKLWRGG